MDRLTDKAIADIERSFDVKRRMAELFDIIVAEFETDPMSRQCFDGRIVQEAIAINRELKQLRKKSFVD